jgi:hypothetical protein
LSFALSFSFAWGMCNLSDVYLNNAITLTG